MDSYTKDELEKALRTITSLISKLEKVQPKLREGTSQRTLVENRIVALHITSSLIEKAMDEQTPVDSVSGA